MPDDKVSLGFPQSLTSNFVTNLSAKEDLGREDPEKLKLLFDLQERQRASEFERDLELKKFEHAQALELSQNRAKEKKALQELIISSLQSCYKMIISLGALAVGTVLVLKGHQQVGYFLLGGGMTSVTTDAVAIMRAVKGAR